MRVCELQEHGFVPLAMPDGDRQVEGAYVGDLLSWVMGRAQADNAWITIMSNVNVIAVASLADTSCVILAEGVDMPEEVLQTARDKDVNVLGSDLPIFETAVRLAGLIA
ncbi:MAG: hypothetical protein E7Z98_08270 [Olsenella sp.]|nr:hypothetical protein [Olsenella sp.]